MNWFLIALGAPILWAVVNVADVYLVNNYSERDRERSSGGLVLFSSLMGIIVSFVIYFFSKDVFNISLFNMLLLLTTGVLAVVWMFFYLYALEIEEISSIAPWFLTIPIFGYILGYIFLGETLTAHQFIGSGIVLLGLVFVSFDFSGEKRKLKKKPVLYMVCACLALAISGIIFKYVTIDGNFWVSTFWEYFGLGVVGLVIYLLIPKYRNEFRYMNKTGGVKIFIVNTVCEIMSFSGNMMTNFALLLAPVTMVYLVSSFQPMIVLFLSVLGTKFFPHIIKENISRKALTYKAFAIVIMIIGSVFLFI